LQVALFHAFGLQIRRNGKQIEAGEYSAGACTCHHIEVVGLYDLVVAGLPLQSFFDVVQNERRKDTLYPSAVNA
jgi:hypothetical protein